MGSWEDTLMSDEQIKAIYGTDEPAFIPRLVAQAQAEITWRAAVKEVVEWLKGRCTKTHCSGDIPTGYLFYIDALSINSLLQGKMEEVVVDFFLGKDAALKIEKVYDKCFKLGGKTGDEDR